MQGAPGCPRTPRPLWPHVPSARAGRATVWHPLTPAWVWAPAETEYIKLLESRTVRLCDQDTVTLHHPFCSSGHLPAGVRAPEGRSTLPKCLSRVGQRMCFSSKLPVNLDAALGSLLGDPLYSPTLGGGCYHFPSTGQEAHHRFQLITEFSLHDLLRRKEPKQTVG